MRKLGEPRFKTTLGVFLMLLSFILSFLMAINVFVFDDSLTIVFCFFVYALSLIGLVLGFFGVYELIILRRKKESGK
ncbi:MAG: hypothetical protein QXR97_00255 [Thermoproteota archaeon]